VNDRLWLPTAGAFALLLESNVYNWGSSAVDLPAKSPSIGV